MTNKKHSEGEEGEMLDALFCVQRILVRNKDLKRLQVLRPLIHGLQNDYMDRITINERKEKNV